MALENGIYVSIELNAPLEKCCEQGIPILGLCTIGGSIVWHNYYVKQLVTYCISMKF